MSHVDLKPMSGVQVAAPVGFRPLAAHWFLIVGVLAMIVPTMVSVAQQSWSTEQGAHGPIVLATGIWLVAILRKEFVPLIRPGSLLLALLVLVPALAIYALARVTTTLELEGFALYFAMVAVAYAYLGAQAMRMLWFPTIYFAFLFPPPDSLVSTLTQPLKLGISRAAVAFFDLFGMPVARKGVIIQVDQYDILVAAACAGLNSIISLSAIGLFYIYMRHNANWRYALLLMLVIVPVALLANFVRVLLLILITYFFGDAWAQGFLHGFAGMVMFAVALLSIFAIDELLSPVRARLSRRIAA
ncbi:exosortase V [Sphingomonas nostoxanthinifaciens]|uniref:exosortase V n=1 Tax=Sphingomonas nostoxanthinifaciens TaxID=2872652 RepID=UPI001CC21547|nr:exosortase V [Sphingomonas nostoxanthinifaciens]UAK24146.1 exosortase V [Sphingomonas nostoxanthinifaciens]